MSDDLLPISNLNDFVFCPVSIYFHSLDTSSEHLLSQEIFQIDGTAAQSLMKQIRYTYSK